MQSLQPARMRTLWPAGIGTRGIGDAASEAAIRPCGRWLLFPLATTSVRAAMGQVLPQEVVRVVGSVVSGVRRRVPRGIARASVTAPLPEGPVHGGRV